MCLVYSIVRLRLPEDDLITQLTFRIENEVKGLSPRDLALVGWALAKTQMPAESTVFIKVRKSMLYFVK